LFLSIIFNGFPVLLFSPMYRFCFPSPWKTMHWGFTVVILNLGTRWRLNGKHHAPADFTVGKHPPVIPKEEVSWAPVVVWILWKLNKFLPCAWNWPKIPSASNV
jgi:hypothetical protein